MINDLLKGFMHFTFNHGNLIRDFNHDQFKNLL